MPKQFFSVQGVGSDGLIKHPISACDSVPGQGFMVITVTICHIKIIKDKPKKTEQLLCSGNSTCSNSWSCKVHVRLAFFHSFWVGCHWMYSIFHDSRRLHLSHATWKHLSDSWSHKKRASVPNQSFYSLFNRLLKGILKQQCDLGSARFVEKRCVNMLGSPWSSRQYQSHMGHMAKYTSRFGRMPKSFSSQHGPRYMAADSFSFELSHQVQYGFDGRVRFCVSPTLHL